MEFSTPNITKSSQGNLYNFCRSIDDFHLVALEAATTASKSVGIGMSLLDGRIGIEHAIVCSRLEEEFQIRENGRIEGVHDRDEEFLRVVFSAAKSLMLLRLENY